MSDFTIRAAVPADAQAIAELHIIGWQEAYRHILPPVYLAGLDVEKRRDFWEQYISQARPVYVAMRDDIAVGFVNVGRFRGEPDNLKGEIYAIYVHPSYHRQGVGRALFEAGRAYLQNEQLIPFGLWVINQTPSHHFYRAMGGDQIAEKQDSIADTLITEWLFVYP